MSQIEQVAIGELRPHPSNVHIHSKKQINKIAKSIGQVGFLVPIVRNETGIDFVRPWAVAGRQTARHEPRARCDGDRLGRSRDPRIHSSR